MHKGSKAAAGESAPTETEIAGWARSFIAAMEKIGDALQRIAAQVEKDAVPTDEEAPSPFTTMDQDEPNETRLVDSGNLLNLG